MKGTKPKISHEQIQQRAQKLLNIFEKMYCTSNKIATYGGLKEDLEGLPSLSITMTELFNQRVIVRDVPTATNKKMTDKTLVKYIGAEPSLQLFVTIIEIVLEKGRKWGETYKEKHGERSIKNTTHPMNVRQAVAVVNSVSTKLVRLHYPDLLKELAVLKERYRLTVPNADIEITIKVSSTASI